MTTFDDRQKAFENKFKYDEDMKFKATARRNKLRGVWAGGKLAKEDAVAYAEDVVAGDFDRPGDEAVIEKILGDFAAAGLTLGRADVVFELERFFAQALEQLRHE